eukprot:1146182-Pelagomonas_calceolata.AAC.2
MFNRVQTGGTDSVTRKATRLALCLSPEQAQGKPRDFRPRNPVQLQSTPTAHPAWQYSQQNHVQLPAQTTFSTMANSVTPKVAPTNSQGATTLLLESLLFEVVLQT